MANSLQNAYINSLQGNSYSLQGSSPYGLQGSSQAIQGPAITQPAAPKPVAPKKITYGNTAATSPKQQYISSIADNDPDANANANAAFFNSNPSVFGGTTNTPTATQPQATQAAPVVDPNQGYKDAYAKYLDSLAPDPAVSSAKTKYLDFVTNEKLGENALEGQGRGIPLSLVRGQQAKLGQQSELEAQRLQGDIGIAQDSQTYTQNQTKARADFEKSLIDQNKPTEVGGNLVQLNPTTGKYETVYNGAKATTPTEVAQGGTLVDPTTGKVIYSSAPKETLPASAQEFQYAVQQGYKGTYEQYQNEDANRKRSVTNINTGPTGLTNQQATLFNNIVNKYQASPLISGADKTAVLTDTISGIRKDPGNGALQLNLAYQYVKALDTYQSAVREGELGLVNSIDSKAGQLQNYVQQINNGQQVRPEIAKQIADAAEVLVNSISSAAKQKQQAYQSQAATLGLGDAWSTYTSGFTSPANPSSQNNDPLGLGI